MYKVFYFFITVLNLKEVKTDVSLVKLSGCMVAGRHLERRVTRAIMCPGGPGCGTEVWTAVCSPDSGMDHDGPYGPRCGLAMSRRSIAA